jgi:hypothetical protein
MKSKTQNLIFFAAAAILVSFLFTCKPFAGGASDGDYDESGDRITYTDVDYSPDGKSLTIYLDGSTPVRHSRALNYRLAVLGHDLFEVAFISHNGKIARRTWEKGSAAGVNGVDRGVNYAAAAVPAGGLNSPDGAAIIFVGKKSDRTLLAVGRLISVDGVPDTTTIGPNSRFVTFQVEPLRAGVTDDLNTTSFTTSGGTDVALVTIGDRDFPLFNVDAGPAGNREVTAEYRFEVNTFGVLNSTYRMGILRGGGMRVNSATDYPSPLPAGMPGWRVPRYPVGDGKSQKWKTPSDSLINPILSVDTYTGVTPLNNSSALPADPGSAAFSNPAMFTIGPTDTNHGGQPFAFSFEIPVYPLTNNDNRRTTGSMWYIRPGYDSYWLDLDDGMGGNGGAILLGTGTFQKSVSTSLSIRQLPIKTRYNTIQGGFNFSIVDPLRPGEGLLVYINYGGSSWPVPNADLHFIIGGQKVIPGDDIGPLLAAITAPANNGIVPVTVEYYGPIGNAVQQPIPAVSPYITNPSPPPDWIFNSAWYTNNGGSPKTTSFDLYYFAPPAGTDFFVPANGNRYVIHNQEAANRMNYNLNNPDLTEPDLDKRRSYLFVFYDSYDLGGIVIPANRFICIIAAKQDIVIGRTVASNGTGSIDNNGTASTYYLGVWPFDEILAVEGMAINSQRFYINAAGSQANVNKETHAIINPGANNYTGTFIHGTGAPTVPLNSSGVTVIDGNLR